jgi:diacylglycerol kinase family enzyme
MKIEPTKIELLHNPTAGAEEHEAAHLKELLNAAGYKVYYGSSKKKVLKKIAVDSRYIVVAGGDGTVRKAVMAMLDKKIKYKRPIAILPLGTANNIASSLKIEENLRLNVDAWRKEKLQKLDVGLVKAKKDEEYFIESFGFGLFPALVKWMDEQTKTAAEDPEDEVRQAHNALLHLSKHYQAFEATLVNDGKEISGNFLMLELLNISRIGPKLEIAKNANPGDGKLELILVKESQRPQLIKYFEDIVSGKRPIFPIKPIQVSILKLSLSCKDLHVDDELKEPKQHTWEVTTIPNVFEILLTN